MLGDIWTRLRLFAVVAVAVAMVYFVVWATARPAIYNDPISLIYSPQRLLSWGLLAMVAGISAVGAVLICRRRLPDLPVLVFGAGICVLSVSSGQAVRDRWAYGAEASYARFALETVLLGALLYGVHLLGKILLTRIDGGKADKEDKGREFSLGTALQSLVLAVVVAFIVAFLVATTTKQDIAGVKSYWVYGSERGQIVFAALAAGFLSSLAAHQTFRPASSVFCWLGVPLMALICYLGLIWLGSPPGEALPNNPLGNFLPIDFAGPGVLGAMLGLLLSHKLFRNRLTEEA